MDNLSIFAERLGEYIEEAGLSETALANKIGRSRATVSGIVNASHRPSTATVIALAEYFGCSVDYLLGIEEIPREGGFVGVSSFAERLRKCLKESGKTEYRLKTDLHVSGSLTYRWLHGNVLPNVESLKKLRKFFSCSIDYLLGRVP